MSKVIDKNNILAIDTTTKNCSVALYAQGGIHSRSCISMKHSSELIGLIKSTLEEQAVSLHELEMVIVDTGPGSFTGVRTGIGVAQGIAYGLGIPLCGIDSLSILAVAAGKQGVVLPIVDARMNQVYAGLYRMGVECEVLVPPYVSNLEELQDLAQEELTVVGDGWQSSKALCQAVLGDKVNFEESVVLPEASAAIAAFIRHGIGTIQSPLELTATYVRNDVVQSHSASPKSASQHSLNEKQPLY